VGGSMSSVVISGDTSGAITLAAPAVAGTNTITLPASTGTMVTTGTPASGNVIQVVNQVVTVGETAIASTTFTDSGLSASITPKFATSKILVMVSQSMGSYRAAGGFIYGDARLMRNSTQINIMGRACGIKTLASIDGDVLVYTVLSLNYLDSPATTSAVTYKTQGRCNVTTSSGIVLFQALDVNSQSTMTLMEIAV
jgi:hypothetical protein